MQKKLWLIILASIVIVSSVVFANDVNLKKEAQSLIKQHIQTFGSGQYDYKDGDLKEAAFRSPYGIAIDSAGKNLYVSDTENNCIRKISLDNKKVSTLTGKVQMFDSYGVVKGGYKDGDLNKALFRSPKGIDMGFDGKLYVADSANHVIRKIVDKKVFTLAGNGKVGATDGKFDKVRFAAPKDLVIDRQGNVWISDTGNNRIRKIDSNSVVSTETKTVLTEPAGLAIDDGTILIADSANHKIRRIKAGKLYDVVGVKGILDKDSGYQLGGYMDGERAKAKFNFPGAIAVKDKRIFIADTFNDCIRLLEDGKISTVLGKGFIGYKNFKQDGIYLNKPTDLLIKDEKLYIVDSQNNRILSVDLKLFNPQKDGGKK